LRLAFSAMDTQKTLRLTFQSLSEHRHHEWAKRFHVADRTAGMEVREATPADAAPVRRVAEVTWHDAHDDIVGQDVVDEFLAEYYDPDDLRERYQSGDGTTFVAVVDGTVVGYASGVPEDDWYTLGSLYVHPDSQGEGVGSALLERVEDAGATAGYDTLRLVVMAGNEASIEFYEARGFGRVGGHYDDLLDVDGYVYAKPLSP
jgi:ribosomal protein S18 acetylase RimI-like enzyme